MKKNLKVLLPTLIVVLAVQFFLVRFYLGQTNQQTAEYIGEVDTSVPYPSSSYNAKQVVQVVLYAIRNNEKPRKDAGVTAVWQFLTPRLKQQLRDKALLRPYLTEDLWLAMTDFDSYRITHSTVDESQAVFEVEVLSAKRLVRQCVIAVHLQNDHWLIDQIVKRL